MASWPLTASDDEQTAPKPRGRRAYVRRAAPAGYLVALALAVALRGLPTSRDALFLWVLLGLLAASLTDVRRRWRSLIVEWLPFGAILFAYDLLRGSADSLVVAAALWLARSKLFRPFVASVSLLAAAGFATYALFPAAPPWLASDEGALEPTDRIVRFVSAAAPFDFFGAVWEHGARYANDVAAVPSLHAAYALLVTLILWPMARRRWRIPLAAYPLAMAFALVYTAEHYVVDVLLGWVYAVAAFVAVGAGARLLARRRA